MKTIIIDDEPKARNLLKVLLEENCPKIETIFMASSLLEGIDLIKQVKPNILFLDIEMPQHSGLELLDFLEPEELTFEIIFTTAFNEFALQAFELSAVDYLLKPLRASKLVKAVEKCSVLLGNSQIDEKLQELKNSLTLEEFKKNGLPKSTGIQFVELKDIILFEGEGMYAKVYLVDQSELLISKPLKYFSDLLSTIPYFYKPHKSYLVNLRYIKEYVKSDGGYVILDNDKTVSVSKEKRNEFLKIVSSI
ncbi:LytR/AlgR family response regulator transcription factor [Spongiimicrobium salis]|uniref:LytR/AlgR family response regulator transcription factor n=1 Tax=Spongiimicrobium salis TaxID=1667022 RepID=UPI00374CB87E